MKRSRKYLTVTSRFIIVTFITAMALNLNLVKEELFPWIENVLKKENIQDVTLEIIGQSEKGGNYMSDIIFLDAKGRDISGEKKTLGLVLKNGKDNKTMREEWQTKTFYQREHTIYGKIFPAFKKFQQEKTVQDIFESIPKCYATLDIGEKQAILLEDLRQNGYELHNRFVPMNIPHIKEVLASYAKFHAISFAMRDQNKELFDRLTTNYDFLYQNALEKPKMRIWCEGQMTKTLEILKEKDPKLANELQKKIGKSVVDLIIDIGNTKVMECVVTHTDCWNNNFMFKYENQTKDTPSKVTILDWELSMLHSPVIDISYFLYLVSKEEVSKLNELIRYYHDKLTENIKELGSDPEKLFPYSKLMEHWEKYSGYGMGILIFDLEVMTCDKEHTLDIEDFEGSQTAWKNDVPKNYEIFTERIYANVKHYCDWNKN